MRTWEAHRALPHGRRPTAWPMVDTVTVRRRPIDPFNGKFPVGYETSSNIQPSRRHHNAPPWLDRAVDRLSLRSSTSSPASARSSSPRTARRSPPARAPTGPRSASASARSSSPAALFALLVMARISPLGPVHRRRSRSSASPSGPCSTQSSLIKLLGHSVFGINGAAEAPLSGLALLLAVPLRHHDRQPAPLARQGQGAVATYVPPRRRPNAATERTATVTSAQPTYPVPTSAAPTYVPTPHASAPTQTTPETAADSQTVVETPADEPTRRSTRAHRKTSKPVTELHARGHRLCEPVAAS